MSALVTGGAGFIGRHVVGELLDRGVAVRVLDDLSRARPGSLEAFRRRSGFLGLAQGDVADPGGAATRADGRGYGLSPRGRGGRGRQRARSGPGGARQRTGHAERAGSGAGGAVAPGAGQYLSRLRLRQPSSWTKGRPPRRPRRTPRRNWQATTWPRAIGRPSRCATPSSDPSTSTGPGSAATWKAAWSRAFFRPRWRSGRWMWHGDGAQTRDFLFVEDAAAALWMRRPRRPSGVP